MKPVPTPERDLQGATPRKRGRPVKYPMPDRIDASPETIAEVVLKAKPKKDWSYEREHGRKRTPG